MVNYVGVTINIIHYASMAMRPCLIFNKLSFLLAQVESRFQLRVQLRPILPQFPFRDSHSVSSENRTDLEIELHFGIKSYAFEYLPVILDLIVIMRSFGEATPYLME